MANMVARSFLSDESRVKLENSVGVRKGIAVEKRIEKLGATIIDNRIKLELAFQLISQINGELNSLRQRSFFAKLFQGKKNKYQIEELEERLSGHEQIKNETIERINALEIEQDRRKRELSQFETELKRVGLTYADIKNEYMLIVHELYLKEQNVDLKVVSGQKNPQRPSQTEKLSASPANQEIVLAGQQPQSE